MEASAGDDGGLPAELTRLAKKQCTVLDASVQNVDALLDALRALREQLSAQEQSSGGDAVASRAAIAACRERVLAIKPRERVQQLQKELHVSLTRVSKALDKQVGGLSFENAVECVAMESGAVGALVANHLYRAGFFDTSLAVAEKVGAELPIERLQPFIAVHDIVLALQRREIEPALRWVAERYKDSAKSVSAVDRLKDLTFLLHRLRFILLLREGRLIDCVLYARAQLAPLASSHIAGIRRLMGALAFASCLHLSPYADMLDDAVFSDAAHVFLREACGLLGLPHKSSLEVLIESGLLAYPALLRYRSLLASRAEFAKAGAALPLQLDLPQLPKLHSVFVCPVSKEQCTVDNPPMMLLCGHVISRDSLMRLGRTPTYRFKCPYCPAEQTREMARQVHF